MVNFFQILGTALGKFFPPVFQLFSSYYHPSQRWEGELRHRHHTVVPLLLQQGYRLFQLPCRHKGSRGIEAADNIKAAAPLLIFLQNLQQNLGGSGKITGGFLASVKRNLGSGLSGNYSDFLIIGGNHDFIEKPLIKGGLDRVGDDGFSAKITDIFMGYPLASASGGNNGQSFHFLFLQFRYPHSSL